MTATSSTALLDLGNTQITKGKAASKSLFDHSNNLINKEKNFSSIYSEKMQAEDRPEDRVAPEKSPQRPDPATAKSQRNDNRTNEKYKKDDSIRKEESASGENLPTEQAAMATASMDKTHACAETDSVEADEDCSSEQALGVAGPVAVTDQNTDAMLMQSEAGIVDLELNEAELEQLADTLTQGEFVGDSANGSKVEDFIAALATIYAGASVADSDSLEGDMVLPNEAASGSTKKSLGQLLQNLIQGQSSGESGSQQGKGAEVSELFKEMIGKVMAKGTAVAGEADAENLDSVLTKLVEGTQAKSPTQNIVPGQLAMQMNSARSDAALNLPYVTSMQQAVDHPEFKDGMAQKLVWMVGQNIQSAKVHLNPAELGPIEMKIQVTKDQAHIQVHSPHAVTRDLMEGTVHRLREMLAEQGIELSQFDVSSQQGQESGNGSSRGNEEGSFAGRELLESDVQVVEQSLASDQLVDTYV